MGASMTDFVELKMEQTKEALLRQALHAAPPIDVLREYQPVLIFNEPSVPREDVVSLNDTAAKSFGFPQGFDRCPPWMTADGSRWAYADLQWWRIGDWIHRAYQPPAPPPNIEHLFDSEAKLFGFPKGAQGCPIFCALDGSSWFYKVTPHFSAWTRITTDPPPVQPVGQPIVTNDPGAQKPDLPPETKSVHAAISTIKRNQWNANFADKRMGAYPFMAD